MLEDISVWSDAEERPYAAYKWRPNPDHESESPAA